MITKQKKIILAVYAVLLIVLSVYSSPRFWTMYVIGYLLFSGIILMMPDKDFSEEDQIQDQKNTIPESHGKKEVA